MIAALSAALLGAAAIAVWFIAAGARPSARVHLRFASILFAALAIACPLAPAAANAVALIVAALGLSVLALAALAAFEQKAMPGVASVVLVLVCLSALVAAVTSVAVFALAPATLALAVILVAALRQFDSVRLSSVQGMLAALWFLAGESAFALDGAGAAYLLFSAAGLLGLALALSRGSESNVEEKRGDDLRRALPVSGAR